MPSTRQCNLLPLLKVMQTSSPPAEHAADDGTMLLYMQFYAIGTQIAQQQPDLDVLANVQ